MLSPNRIASLFRHFRKHGFGHGYWMWKIECNLLLDCVGDWFNQTIQSLKESATRARWNNDEQTADSICAFIEDMKLFHMCIHPHLYNIKK